MNTNRLSLCTAILAIGIGFLSGHSLSYAVVASITGLFMITIAGIDTD